MINSVSSFSFVGDTGAPMRMGADSPLKRSPKIGFGPRALSGVDALLVLNFGTNAANDFARECSTLPLRDNEAAAGWALDKLDSNRAPRAGRGVVVATLDGTASCAPS